MAKFQGGLEEVIKALALMTSEERERLLSDMAAKDPRMVELIKSKLFTLRDLEFVTPKMLVDFLRNVEFDDFARALRLYDRSLAELIGARVSKSMREQIFDIVDGPKLPKKDVMDSESKVLSVFRQMIDRGEIIISKSDDYV